MWCLKDCTLLIDHVLYELRLMLKATVLTSHLPIIRVQVWGYPSIVYRCALLERQAILRHKVALRNGMRIGLKALAVEIQIRRGVVVIELAAVG